MLVIYRLKPYKNGMDKNYVLSIFWILNMIYIILCLIDEKYGLSIFSLVFLEWKMRIYSMVYCMIGIIIIKGYKYSIERLFKWDVWMILMIKIIMCVLWIYRIINLYLFHRLKSFYLIINLYLLSLPKFINFYYHK